MIAVYEPKNRVELVAAMADAVEGLGLVERCLEFHKTAVMFGQMEWDKQKWIPPVSVLARCGRLAQAQGDLVEGNNQLSLVLIGYKRMIHEKGLAGVDVTLLAMLPPLRHLVAVKRAAGRDLEGARKIELELDETEAILAALKPAALEELRGELRAAAEAEAAAAEEEKEAREAQRAERKREAERAKRARRQEKRREA